MAVCPTGPSQYRIGVLDFRIRAGVLNVRFVHRSSVPNFGVSELGRGGSDLGFASSCSGAVDVPDFVRNCGSGLGFAASDWDAELRSWDSDFRDWFSEFRSGVRGGLLSLGGFGISELFTEFRMFGFEFRSWGFGFRSRISEFRVRAP